MVRCQRVGLSGVLGALLVATTWLGCATYRDDLDRAMGHYNANEYDRSLALLSVLEPDLDSLSSAERAQYEYYRGMAHFRLEQKYHARHWLGRAAAREKLNPGALSAEELGRLKDTLGKLNEARYGDATVTGARSCTVAADCSDGEECVDGKCHQNGAAAPNDTQDGDKPAADASKPAADASKPAAESK